MNQPSTNIVGNTFYGVHWDGKALEAVNSVARALENMTHLFKAQNVSIEALLRVDAAGAQRPEPASGEGSDPNPPPRK